MPRTLGRTFDSLRVRNYRRFFAGQVFNWTGTWVSWTAQGWLVLELTGSGLGLGAVIALQWLPVLLFGAFAGVVADRFDNRRILICTNLINATFSLLLGIATVTGIVTIWMVIAIAMLMGFVTAVDDPTRQTFTMQMAGRSRLTNAVSLNTATFTTARVLGPAIAGLMIHWIGIGECFLVNTASFGPVVFALATMKRDELHEKVATERKPGQVREGLRYMRSNAIVRTLLIMMAVIGTLKFNMQVLLPVLAKETFSGDARTLGLLGACLGAGMLMGSITNATFGRPTRGVLLTAGFAAATTTMLVAAAPSLWLAALLLIPEGMAAMAFLATMNPSLQLNTSDQMRGRVMALYFVFFLGSTAIGAPLIGWVAEVLNPRVALAVGGIATFATCIYGWFRLPHYDGRTSSPEDVEARVPQPA